MYYRLQRKESISRPCIIGNCSMPLPSYRWKDVAVSDDLLALREYEKRLSNSVSHRIIDDTTGKVV